MCSFRQGLKCADMRSGSTGLYKPCIDLLIFNEMSGQEKARRTAFIRRLCGLFFVYL